MLEFHHVLYASGKMKVENARKKCFYMRYLGFSHFFVEVSIILRLPRKKTEATEALHLPRDMMTEYQIQK